MTTIHTTRGAMALDDLTVLQGTDENDDARVEWTEYRTKEDGELVRRDAHVTLKGALPFVSEQGHF